MRIHPYATTFEAARRSIVRELFVNTADGNYIAARWCAFNQLNGDFLWLALHSLEKYMKAILLLNERPAGHAHDISALFSEVKGICRDLIPDRFYLPDALTSKAWPNRTTEEFVAHINRHGDPHNRYMIYGYVTPTDDLHHLDAMVFTLRRMICALNAPIVESDGTKNLPTHYELLSRNPNYRPDLRSQLDRLIKETDSTPLRAAALRQNYSFAADGFSYEDLRIGVSSRSTVLDRLIREPLFSNDPATLEAGIKTTKWLRENVKLPVGVTKDLKTKIEGAEVRLRDLTKQKN